MANVTFILKEPESKAPTLVYLIYRFNNQRLKYSTGQKILPKFWNFDKQRVKENRQFPEYGDFNAFLNNLEAKTHSAYRSMLIDGKSPSPDALRIALNEAIDRTEKTQRKDFVAFMKHSIENSHRQIGTLKHYRQTVSRIQDYNAHSRTALTFEDITLTFYKSFIRFCTDKGYGINTIGGYIKNIKTFMGEAVDQKLTTNLEFRSRKFKKMSEESESIYLTLDEIARLRALDLSDDLRLDRVRDLFVVGCYTGLRFSDLVQINEKNLSEGYSRLNIRMQKTGSRTTIPLNSFVREIITKYEGNLPTDISNQKMNDYLKEIGVLAELSSKVQLTFTKGGVREKETFYKHELITVHTARRSFATNAYLMDIPAISIMKITGHKTERSFMTYIKMSQEDNANKLISHPFFT
jgi:integrase